MPSPAETHFAHALETGSPAARAVVGATGGDQSESALAMPGQAPGSPAASDRCLWVVRRGLRHRRLARGQGTACRVVVKKG